MTTLARDDRHDTSSPAALVAIARAAHIASDRDLERAAKAQLAERYGIRITFERTARPQPVVATEAQR